MNLYYASTITFPSLPVNRLQTLNTSEAYRKAIEGTFVLGASMVDLKNGYYSGTLKNFGYHKSYVSAWHQLSYLKQHNFDVVYSREIPLVWAMILLNKLFFRLPIRFVFELHDIPSDFRLTFALKNCLHIFCISKAIQHDIEKLVPGVTTSILRNGVNLELTATEDVSVLRTRYGLPLDIPIVSYIGSVGTHGWKGDDVLLDAREHTKGTNIHYTIVGVKDHELEEVRQKFGDQNTTIIGRLTEKEVAEVEALSDILVLPNKPENVMAERYTSPIKMFSYMRSRTPIVASNLPSIREVLDGTAAFFFEPGNSKALAEAIQQALSNKEDAKRRAEKARLIVEDCSWENKADKMIGCLKDRL